MRPLSLPLFGVALLVSSCQQDITSRPLTVLFDREWYSTFEKDEQEFFLFTPKARTQAIGWQYEGFRLNTDGTYQEYGIGPADGPETRPGTWQKTGELTYRIKFTDPERQGYTLRVQLLSDSTLKARRVN